MKAAVRRSGQSVTGTAARQASRLPVGLYLVLRSDPGRPKRPPQVHLTNPYTGVADIVSDLAAGLREALAVAHIEERLSRLEAQDSTFFGLPGGPQAPKRPILRIVK